VGLGGEVQPGFCVELRDSRGWCRSRRNGRDDTPQLLFGERRGVEEAAQVELQVPGVVREHVFYGLEAHS
jgi:hypothetical protein